MQDDWQDNLIVYDGELNYFIDEISFYLLMYVRNLVDWYLWGEVVFVKVKCENKFIFLLIGYLSCYWCYVMECELFFDEEIVEFFNDNFVCIKVDCEE